MNYYYDCEFLEGVQTRRFAGARIGNTKPTVDIVSIGIVAEDGREYYAISKDFNIDEAWNRWQQRIGQGDRNNTEPKEYWIRENVLYPIYRELFTKETGISTPDVLNNLNYIFSDFRAYIEKHGKTNKQIAEEIKAFCAPVPYWRTATFGDNVGLIAASEKKYYSNEECWKDIKIKENVTGLTYDILHGTDKQINLYGYYSAYDHVALCWLFGKMINLPERFPMYTKDLKQMLDEKVELLTNKDFFTIFHDKVEMSFDEKLKMVKEKHIRYPKQNNLHNALEDARWNKQLHEFIKSL
jgi:hypothetical protein